MAISDYSSKRAGFSLIELIIVIAVMAAIAGAIIPSISGATDAAKTQRAIAAAESLNAAQVNYRLIHGASGWNVADQGQCYNNVKPYLDFADADLSALNTRLAPYTVEFQAMTSEGRMQKVVLKKSGTNVAY